VTEGHDVIDVGRAGLAAWLHALRSAREVGTAEALPVLSVASLVSGASGVARVLEAEAGARGSRGTGRDATAWQGRGGHGGTLLTCMIPDRARPLPLPLPRYLDPYLSPTPHLILGQGLLTGLHTEHAIPE